MTYHWSTHQQKNHIYTIQRAISNILPSKMSLAIGVALTLGIFVKFKIGWMIY